MLGFILSISVVVAALAQKKRNLLTIGLGAFLTVVVKIVRGVEMFNGFFPEILYWLEIVLVIFTSIYFIKGKE